MQIEIHTHLEYTYLLNAFFKILHSPWVSMLHNYTHYYYYHHHHHHHYYYYYYYYYTIRMSPVTGISSWYFS